MDSVCLVLSTRAGTAVLACMWHGLERLGFPILACVTQLLRFRSGLDRVEAFLMGSLHVASLNFIFSPFTLYISHIPLFLSRLHLNINISGFVLPLISR